MQRDRKIYNQGFSSRQFNCLVISRKTGNSIPFFLDGKTIQFLRSPLSRSLSTTNPHNASLQLDRRRNCESSRQNQSLEIDLITIKTLLVIYISPHWEYMLLETLAVPNLSVQSSQLVWSKLSQMYMLIR